jgi:hypothetical protein
MQTIVDLDEKLLREAEQVAAREGRTLSALLEDALRARLPRDERPEGSPGPLPPLPPAFRPPPGKEGLMPGFTWENLVHESQEIDPFRATP